ncbi:RNA polymerase sigma-70 factor (sigma-E family) [Catenulispora sp. GAS73]|uniref:SigE family RNA polymerase sigma factor n=1 Tax=Catenulispora sp. GAS73 TaxID=3156269 RepID=UPI003513F7FD
MFRGASTREGRNLNSIDDEFTEFVRGRSQQLKRAAFLITGDVHAAEDLLQTTLARLYASWRRVAAAENVDAYAQRVLVTTHLGQRRRRWWGEHPAAVLPDVVGRDADLGRVDDRAVLRQALATLTPRQRVAVVLRYYSELSEADAARAMGCSVGTVKTLSSRGLGRLRDHFARESTAPRDQPHGRSAP